MTAMTELLGGVLRVPISLWAILFVTGLFAWLSLLAAVKAEQRVGDGRRLVVGFIRVQVGSSCVSTSARS